MYYKELRTYFSLLQNSPRSIQANVVDHHAKLGENISRKTILGKVIIIFDYRSFQNLEMTKLTHSFFCYWLKKQLDVENVKIRKGNSKENVIMLLYFKAEKNGRKIIEI